MSLPKITAPIPYWNPDIKRRDYIAREVEVLTVHFGAGTMRVRVVTSGAIYDLPSGAFFDQLEVHPK